MDFQIQQDRAVALFDFKFVIRTYEILIGERINENSMILGAPLLVKCDTYNKIGSIFLSRVKNQLDP